MRLLCNRMRIRRRNGAADRSAPATPAPSAGPRGITADRTGVDPAHSMLSVLQGPEDARMRILKMLVALTVLLPACLGRRGLCATTGGSRATRRDFRAVSSPTRSPPCAWCRPVPCPCQVRSVTFLYGGAATERLVTVVIWDDNGSTAAGRGPLRQGVSAHRLGGSADHRPSGGGRPGRRPLPARSALHGRRSSRGRPRRRRDDRSGPQLRPGRRSRMGHLGLHRPDGRLDPARHGRRRRVAELAGRRLRARRQRSLSGGIRRG